MRVKIKMFLHWRQESWQTEPSYVMYSCDMSDTFDNCVCLGERDVTVEAPDDFDPRPGLIDGLRAQKQKVMADAQVKVNQIEERIQQLLCIEHKPEVEA